MNLSRAVPEIFDRNARRRRRDRTAGRGEAFLTGLIVDELIARLDAVSRAFAHALLIGAEPRLHATLVARGMAVTVVDPSPARAATRGGLAAEEDDMGGATALYDLIIAAGTLDTVTDLPGALIQLRRALVPDGLLLACFVAAPSLPTLRRAITAADRNADNAVARMHPQIDVRAAGDLLVRAGFALPVADVDSFDLRYRTCAGLVADLRAAAMTNVLADRYRVTRSWWTAVQSAFMAEAQMDGRVAEVFSLITLTGWAPSPDQPKPAARGSGTASLATALASKT